MVILAGVSVVVQISSSLVVDTKNEMKKLRKEEGWNIIHVENIYIRKKESLRGGVFRIPPPKKNTSGFPLKRGRIKAKTHSAKSYCYMYSKQSKNIFFTAGRTIITCTYIPWVEP